MKYRIGVFGSNQEEISKEVIAKAKQIGKVLSNYDLIVITGASFGIPYQAAHEAARKGIEVWGYSPAERLQNLPPVRTDERFWMRSFHSLTRMTETRNT